MWKSFTFLVLFGLLTVNAEEYESYQCGDALADIVLVIDSSASISGHYHTQLEFMANITEHFTIGPEDVQFGAVLYSGTTKVLFYLDTYTNNFDLQQAILNAPFLKGSTRTNEGLNVARTKILSSRHGARANVTHLVIVITDGKSNNAMLTSQEATLLKATGAQVLAIGVGRHTVRSELLHIATSIRNVIETSSYITLDTIGKMVGERTCQTVKEPTPDPPSIEFSSSPAMLNYLSSPSQTLDCQVVRHPKDETVISSLVIKRTYNESSVEDEVIAQVSTNFSAQAVMDDEDMKVFGAVRNGTHDREFITIEWQYPQDTVEGSYVCEASGVNKRGVDVTFTNATQLIAKPFTKLDALEYIKNKQKELNLCKGSP